MREPGFWHGPSSWKSHLLRPLGVLYGAIAGDIVHRDDMRKSFLVEGRERGLSGGAEKLRLLLGSQLDLVPLFHCR